MWTPAVAMLWESWRLSRRRMGILVVVSSFGGAALLASPMDRGEAATFALVLAGFTAWFGQTRTAAIEARRGFTLRLGFTRPVSTWKLVSVPLTFVGLSSAVGYLIPVLTLRGLFGVGFPLLPMAAVCATAAVVSVASLWWTDDPVLRALGSGGLYFAAVVWWLRNQTEGNDLPPTPWSELFAFSPETYAGMALVCSVALGVAVAGVAQQRRGDELGGTLRRLVAGSHESKGGRLFDRVRERLPLPCPTSSAVRAQIWFEVKSVGVHVVMSGARTAVTFFVFLLIADAFVVQGEYLLGFMMLAALMPLIRSPLSLLGLTRKQGAVYLGTFGATRGLETGRLVAVKLLVSWVSGLIAFAMVLASLGVFVVGFVDWGTDLGGEILEYVPSLGEAGEPAAALAALAVQAAAALALAGAFHALVVLNSRRVMLCGLAIVLYVTGVAVVVGGLDGGLIFAAHLAVVAAGFLLGVAWLLRRDVVERILSARVAGVAVVVGVAFAVLTREMNIYALNPGGRGMEETVVGLLIGLLPLAAVAVLPWSFSRLRHR